MKQTVDEAALCYPSVSVKTENTTSQKSISPVCTAQSISNEPAMEQQSHALQSGPTVAAQPLFLNR